MSGIVDMGLHGLGQGMRTGWYFALNRLVGFRAARIAAGLPGDPRRENPPPRADTPTSNEILADLGRLILRDAEAVREGIYPPMPDAGGIADQVARARHMLADLPATVGRRLSREAATAIARPEAEGLPSYYTQDFHFQTGGYLTDEWARLYDVQVETLFLGGAAPMRREALRPIADFMRGRDQRKVALLDAACGTGRFLRDCRIAWPAMRLTGLDLSSAYVDEARRHMGTLRPAELIAGDVARMAVPDASQDIVVSIFLFHELPPEVRRAAAAEFARVLKPGALLVFVDSLQLGDRPAWDGLLENFPVRFHEPFYRHYISDDLDALFRSARLAALSSWTAFFSKVMVCRKAP